MSASPPHDIPDDGPHHDRARAGDDVDRRDLAAVAGGDTAALERLYGRHAPALHAFIRRYVGDRQLAEEALQDTMVAVWERAATFRSESTVRTWMFGVARFRALVLAAVAATQRVNEFTLGECGFQLSSGS